MLSFRRSPVTRTVVVPVTLLSFLSACYKWSTVDDPVAATLAGEQLDKVQVTTTAGEVFVLEAPIVTGDTLSGAISDGSARSIALDEVERVEQRKTDTAANLALAVATLGLIALGVVVAVLSVDWGLR